MQTGNCIFSNVETKKVLWEVTSHCPLACRHCSMNSGPKWNSYFDLSLLSVVIDQLIDRAISKVVLSGGEPFAHPSLAAIVAGCVKAGFEVSVSTSGSFVRPLDLDDCIRSGLRKLTLSVDGTPTAHDARRGKDTYDAMLRLLSLAITRDIEITLNLVIGSETSRADLVSVVELAERAGIESVVFCSEIDSGRGRGCRPSSSTLQSIVEIENYSPKPVNISVLTPLCKSASCPSGTTVYHVDVGGVVHDMCVYEERIRSTPMPVSVDLTERAKRWQIEQSSF